MSRRPRRNRPPRLDDLFPPDAPAPGPAAEARGPSERTPRRLLLDARVTGPHSRLGREAVRHAIRSLVNGQRSARLGCDDLDDTDPDEVRAALEKTHGWDPAPTRAAIDPDATLAGLAAAASRIHDAASSGARIAVATGRPASLLGLAQWTAVAAADAGASVLTARQAAVDGARGRELWWVGDVAAVTDGAALLADDGIRAGDEWLFAVGRPDLVVADRGFAGAALRAGVEVVAWADLDAPALALAAARGRSMTVVPLDEARPAAAYDAVIAVLEGGLGAPRDPHSTTRSPQA